MALIPISETQLVFSYLHSYMTLNSPCHFILPSLLQEGGYGGFQFEGADLVIDRSWLIQFKRPFYFSTAGIQEFWNYQRPPNFDPGYYRFYIKMIYRQNSLIT